MPNTNSCNQSKLILEDILPVPGEMASSFCYCLASVFLSRNSNPLTFPRRWNPKSNRMGYIYMKTLTASGLGFSYVFKNGDKGNFDKTDYYKAFDNDQYINYALASVQCNYRIITSKNENIQSVILESLQNNMPVIAEGVADNTWCLITGCTQDCSVLYGYTSDCRCCQDCVNCIGRDVDGHCENGMFYKSSWEKTLKRIVVIEDFNGDSLNYQDFIRYWISIMKQESKNGFIFGQDAYDSHIQFLSDDENFFDKDPHTLREIYRFIFTNCFVPEYRHHSSMVIFDVLQIPSELLTDLAADRPTSLNEKLSIVRGNGFQAHNIGYKFWAALSEKGMWQANGEKYSEMLRNRVTRKKAITQLNKIKELDAITLQAFESIV